MATNVLMPALSPTMEEGKLSKWLKKEGDAVRPGDVLAEVETDKATMEVEAVDEGTLARILVPGGTENVAVNTLIAVISNDREETATPQKPSPGTRKDHDDQGEEKPASVARACNPRSRLARLL